MPGSASLRRATSSSASSHTTAATARHADARLRHEVEQAADEQDDADGEEDVVEAADEAELLLVPHRDGALPLAPLRKLAQGRGLLHGDDALTDGSVEIGVSAALLSSPHWEIDLSRILNLSRLIEKSFKSAGRIRLMAGRIAGQRLLSSASITTLVLV